MSRDERDGLRGGDAVKMGSLGLGSSSSFRGRGAYQATYADLLFLRSPGSERAIAYIEAHPERFPRYAAAVQVTKEATRRAYLECGSLELDVVARWVHGRRAQDRELDEALRALVEDVVAALHQLGELM